MKNNKKEIKCKGILGKIFGHKYIAAYNYGSPKYVPGKQELFWSSLFDMHEDMINASKPKQHNQTFCERCGNILYKKKP